MDLRLHSDVRVVEVRGTAAGRRICSRLERCDGSREYSIVAAISDGVTAVRASYESTLRKPAACEQHRAWTRGDLPKVAQHCIALLPGNHLADARKLESAPRRHGAG